VAPAGAAEGLLATQMVASHNASLHLLRRAWPSLSRSASSRRARASMAAVGVFLKQLDRYARHRGRSGRHPDRACAVVEDGKVTVPGGGAGA